MDDLKLYTVHTSIVLSDSEQKKMSQGLLLSLQKDDNQRLENIPTTKAGNHQLSFDMKVANNQAETGLQSHELPQVTTVDAIQEHESNIIICDWINIIAGAGMGFGGDNRRAIVALTRDRADSHSQQGRKDR
ncbi:hypothetical protein TSTA_034800 [Talaromyces stipitatus ATCC 10500]|uniref:DNA2/NAM7 helicase-like C-terminal domain-containing protein n=1 Tax=Talaromyces stipitatus (strain ATCC 10500 / CBS 375.48 / QM 6759 / NRRL 1006) TaxID=441959 RepID=B8M725_TALSN|nr:uncharacterized protein TSTA_034800 [Talaromyces stipitatus ATCC 10500]EED20245.1 hypothetical protein TSTA_034800 [Talaromyces stipitatus ATCC 10500]